MNILFIIIGSLGDILPIYTLCKYLNTKNINCYILSHSNLINNLDNPNIKYYKYNSKKVKTIKVKTKKLKTKKLKTKKVKTKKLNYINFNDNSTVLLKYVSSCNNLISLKCLYIKKKINIDDYLSNIYNNTIYITSKIYNNIDLVVGMNNNVIVSSICEKYNLPLINIMHFPFLKNTVKFPHPFLCCDSLLSNYKTWIIYNRIEYLNNKLLINKYRKILNLKSFSNYNNYINYVNYIPQIFTISKYFVGNINEWKKKNILLSGFIINKQIEKFPNDIKKKIKDYKTIYIGFGSVYINLKYSKQIFNIIYKLSNYKFIIQGNIAEQYKKENYNYENVIIMDSFPHYTLFKYVDLVICSGGIGITITSLLLNKPVIIIPIAPLDQKLNGLLVKKNKLGTLVFLDKISKDLYNNINYIINSKIIKNNVSKFSSNIQKEDPLNNIYNFILKNNYIPKLE